MYFQSVIQMEGFRSLGEGEEVEFIDKKTDKGMEATLVTGPQGQACTGSIRRPGIKNKKTKKFR